MPWPVCLLVLALGLMLVRVLLPSLLLAQFAAVLAKSPATLCV